MSTSAWVLFSCILRDFEEKKWDYLECMGSTFHVMRDNKAGPNPDIHTQTHRLWVSRSSDCQTINCTKVPPRRLSYFIHTGWKSASLQTLLSGITDSLKCAVTVNAQPPEEACEQTGRSSCAKKDPDMKAYTENGQVKRIMSICLYELMFCSKPLVLLAVLKLEEKFGWCEPSWCKTLARNKLRRAEKASFQMHLVSRPHLLQMFRGRLRDFCEAPENVWRTKKTPPNFPKRASNPQLCVICFGVVKVNRYFAKDRPVPVPTILGPGALTADVSQVSEGSGLKGSGQKLAPGKYVHTEKNEEFKCSVSSGIIQPLLKTERKKWIPQKKMFQVMMEILQQKVLH